MIILCSTSKVARVAERILVLFPCVEGPYRLIATASMIIAPHQAMRDDVVVQRPQTVEVYFVQFLPQASGSAIHNGIHDRCPCLIS